MCERERERERAREQVCACASAGLHMGVHKGRGMRMCLSVCMYSFLYHIAPKFALRLHQHQPRQKTTQSRAILQAADALELQECAKTYQACPQKMLDVRWCPSSVRESMSCIWRRGGNQTGSTLSQNHNKNVQQTSVTTAACLQCA